MISGDDIVTVVAIEDPVQQSIIEDVLADADIPYLVKGAGVQNLIGAGQLGGGNILTGPIQIQVPLSDYDQAKELIAQALANSTLEDISIAEAMDEDIQEDSNISSPVHDDTTVEKQAAHYSKYCAIWSVLWLFGIGSLIAIYYGIKALTLLRGYPRAFKIKAVFGIILGIIGLIVWVYFWGIVFR